MTPEISPQLLDALRRMDTCRAANAIETFKVRLRNEGFTNGGLTCRFPQLGTMVGRAVTVRVRSSTPPPDQHPYLDRTDWWNHILSVPGPRVVVVQDVDERPGLGAFIGEMHAQVLSALGCVGAVTSGAVRDLPAVAGIGFHLFSQGVSVSHSYIHIVDFGHPVEVAGLRVAPGDLLMGDAHGVVSVPLEIAAQLPAVAAEQAEREHRMLQLCRVPGLTVENLRHLVGQDM